MLYYATTNPKKFEITSEKLKKFGIEIKQGNLDVPEIKGEDIARISEHKANIAFKLLGKPVIADDGGFFIKSLGGFPGVNTAFVTKTIGIKKILDLMKNEKDKTCIFKISVSYVDENCTKTFQENCEGEIASELGNPEHKRFSINSIFIPKGTTEPLTNLDKKDQEKYFFSKIEKVFGDFARWYKYRKFE